MAVAPLPQPQEVDLAVQNNLTGQVDYLKFNGSTLTASALFDYGISGWDIVAQADLNHDGNLDLVAQNRGTGQLDFLFLDAHANLMATSLSNVVVPHVVGVGFFGGVGALGQDFVSQLPNGQLDFLNFDRAGTLIRSDLVANTAGFQPVVGVGEAFDPIEPELRPLPAFSAGSYGHSNVILQNPDGALDSIGFTGSIGSGDLTFASSYLISLPLPSVQAINQNGTFFDADIQNNPDPVHIGTWSAAVQAVAQIPSGQFDVMYFDSGYNTGNVGQFYASNLLDVPLQGWSVVDASGVTASLFHDWWL